MTEINDLANEVTTRARDAAYVVVGLGVLGLQRAQVQRNELQKLANDLASEERLDDVRSRLTCGVRHLDGFVDEAVHFVEAALEPLEEQLPTVARELADLAHAQVRQVREQIRELVGTAG